MELLSSSQVNPRRSHSLAASESLLNKRPAHEEATAAAQEQETDKEEEALKQNGVAEEAEDGVEGLILDGGVAEEDVGVKGVQMVDLLTDHFDNGRLREKNHPSILYSDPLIPAPHKAEKVKYLNAMKVVALSITSDEWTTVTSEGAEKITVATIFKTVQDGAMRNMLEMENQVGTHENKKKEGGSRCTPTFSALGQRYRK
jgi:hypothetical protein